MPRRVEWLNENRYRRYPFVEDVFLVSVSGIGLPDSMILDLQCVDYTNSLSPLRLTGVSVGTSLTITLTSDLGTIYTFSVPSGAAFPYTATVFDAEAQRGICVFGEGAQDMMDDHPGTYTFTTPPVIEPALVSSQNNHRVASIAASVAASPHAVLTGIVDWQEGYNCLISVTEDTDTIRISAISGAGDGVLCAPPATQGIVNCDEVLLRINGLHGDSFGNFLLRGVKGIVVEPDAANNVVVIKASDSLTEIICKG